MEWAIFVDLVVGPLGGLELLLDSADVALGKPVPVLVGALRSRAAMMRALVVLDLPCRDVVFRVRVVVEPVKGGPEFGGEFEVPR